jgi:CheY-like chemotaxis protein
MKKIIVLVVDDNLVNRLLPAFILKSMHPQVEVFEVGSGEDALSFIEVHHVTHILLDISMPGLDGIQVAQMIKEKSIFPSVSLIAYTADALMLDGPYAQSLGFDDVVLKPVDRLNLFRALGL